MQEYTAIMQWLNNYRELLGGGGGGGGGVNFGIKY